MDHKLIVIYSDGRQRHSALSLGIGFLEADCRPKVLAGHGAMIHQGLDIALCVGCYFCVISKLHMSNEYFADLGLGSEAGEIEKPAI